MDFPYEDIFENDLDLLEIVDFGVPRRVYERNNAFDNLSPLDFYRRFRLTRETCHHVLLQIEDELEYDDNANNSVSLVNQLLTALNFDASGSHLLQVADYMNMDESTVSRIIGRVSRAIARLYNNYIHIPRNREEIQETQAEFFGIARFPRVLGVIDGTHIRIQSPGGPDAEVFRNRKSYFSINVQSVCDSKLKIMDLVARWPGSTHDATIFNNCRLRARFENGDFRNCVLLGDSGYPLRPYFFTSLLNPLGQAQIRYSESIIRTRNVVERNFGCWKRRFPVLAYELRLKIETTLNVIIACGVLQNIALEMNDPQPPPADGIDQNELEQLIELGQIPNIPHLGNNNIDLQPRDDFINNYSNVLPRM